jgi:hypothetical protein
MARKGTRTVSNEDRGRAVRAEFCPDDSLVGEGDELEDGVTVGEVAVGEIREVDIPDGIRVDEDGVGVGGGISRLEGIGMEEVSDATGELREPVMPLMLNEEASSDELKT